MKKQIALFLALLFVLSLTACRGAGDDSSDPVSSQPAASGVEIAPSVYAQNTDTVFEEGTQVTATPITSGAAYEAVKTAVSDVAEKFAAYDLQAVKDNAQVQPNGKLRVVFALPADFSTNVTVYYISDEGQREKLTTAVDAAARTASAELAHFSTYVLADAGEQPTSTTTADATTSADAITTTTTGAVTTTTQKAATTTTTKKPTTTTTTKAGYSAFVASDWVTRKVDGDFCNSTVLVFTEDTYHYDETQASPYAMMTEGLTPEQIKEYEIVVDFEYNGVKWTVGAGASGIPLRSVTEKDNRITIVDDEGKELVLERTGEGTAKVISNASTLGCAAGDVFTAVAK